MTIHKKFCPSRKKKYATEEYATEKGKRLNKKFGGTTHTAYFCIQCGAYHLTTMPKKQYDKIQRNIKAIRIQQEAEYWENRLK